MQASRVLRSASKTVPTSFQGLRTWGNVGRYLRDRPNAVPETQAYFAHKPAETYIAKSSDNTVVGGVMLLTLFGFLLAGKGAADAILGINKKPLA